MIKPTCDIPDRKNKELYLTIDELVRHSKKRITILGITGAGGAGKTTLSQNLCIWYGPTQSLAIDLDDYLISRAERGKLGLVGYQPEANRLELARQNLSELKHSKKIIKPRYDHTDGSILSDEELSPKPLIIIEGVTTLYPQLASEVDISIFLDAKEETQWRSRIERDVKNRGYSMQEARILYENLKPFYSKFIAPTKSLATISGIVTQDYVFHKEAKR